jgi:hypothetical protein
MDSWWSIGCRKIREMIRVAPGRMPAGTWGIAFGGEHLMTVVWPDRRPGSLAISVLGIFPTQAMRRKPMKMNRHNSMMLPALLALVMLPTTARAGVAETSATAGSRGFGPGTAGATATYDGDGIGLTRTQATSGRVSVARGLSVGVDRDGLSVSHSYALAGRVGPAVGGTFNLHVGPDGKGMLSVGRADTRGDRQRAVSVGGAVGTRYGRPVAEARATGSTGRRGAVRANTFSRSSRGFDRARGGPRVSRRSRLR